MQFAILDGFVSIILPIQDMFDAKVKGEELTCDKFAIKTHKQLKHAKEMMKPETVDSQEH